jgi:tungstate transport system ATP-binding protein
MVPIAVLESVTKILSEKTVLDNVTLQVIEGEILALLGPNGAGKTTLLKILASILKPTSGEVYFQGVRVTDQNREKIRLESTLIFQRTVLFSTTVYDNVAYGLRIRKAQKKEIDEKIAQVLRLVRLEGFEKRHARKLSGGEQQRVALARALVLNTRLLLLDEPTANLDPQNTAIIEGAIAKINRELKTTVVVATHNMFQARNLPHRIALISDGKIGEVGTPTEVFGRLSKTLIGFTVGENVFSGTARTQKNGTALIDIGNDVQLEATTQQEGEICIFISPNDIILSKNPISSSARNVLKGEITEILDLDSVVKLKVDAGKLFAVQITKHSFNDMRLNLNSEIYMVFKASSIQII